MPGDPEVLEIGGLASGVSDDGLTNTSVAVQAIAHSRLE